MSSYRQARINEDMRREMTDVLRSVKDPRVSSDVLTILRADVTKDLSLAKIYVSALTGENETNEAVKGLTAASGYIRTQLASRMKLRKMPELKFIADNSTKEFFKLDSLLKSVLPNDDQSDEDAVDAD